MSWARDADGKFVKPNRPPDFKYKGGQFWAKEMLSLKDGIVAPIMECPVSGEILVFRTHSWYMLTPEVTRQYVIWITDNILLK